MHFNRWTCRSEADWLITYGYSPDGWTTACTRHVGFLLTDTPEHTITQLAILKDPDLIAKELGRVLTDEQAAQLAKQASKYDKSMPRSQKGITVESGRVTVSDGKVSIEREQSGLRWPLW